MKRIIRYLLNGDGSVPNFVTDGGYFPVGEELIGISVDDQARHLPESVHRLTKQQLIDRVVGRSRKPFFQDEHTEETATEFLNAWLASKGVDLE